MVQHSGTSVAHPSQPRLDPQPPATDQVVIERSVYDRICAQLEQAYHRKPMVEVKRVLQTMKHCARD